MTKKFSRGEEAAQHLSDFLNGSRITTDFIDTLARDHPTIQQNMTRLCVTWFEHMALNQRRVDDRNQASVDLAKAFLDKVPHDTRILPYI